MNYGTLLLPTHRAWALSFFLFFFLLIFFAAASCLLAAFFGTVFLSFSFFIKPLRWNQIFSLSLSSLFQCGKKYKKT